MNRDQWADFRDSLDTAFEQFLYQDEINARECERMKLWLDTAEAEACAQRLYSRREVRIPSRRLQLRLARLREIDRTNFYHIEVRFKRRAKRRKVKCFVGYRFIPEVRETLLYNLKQVLHPYNVELDWSGRDIRSVQILDDIMRRIRRADFCVFDNRATEGKPNVYVEVGICYAIRKPFILFEYEPLSSDVPSDLGFAFAVRYTHYRQLFRDFYYRLPLIFRKNIHTKRSCQAIRIREGCPTA